MHQKDLNHSRQANSYNNSSRPLRRSYSLGWNLNKAFIMLFGMMIIIYVFSLGLNILPLLVMDFAVKTPGYYVYNKKPYYLYSSCSIFEEKECEWYYYDVGSNEWSASDTINAKKAKYIGDEWNNYLDIDIQSNLKDQDWFKELHPPTPTTGYYQYNGKTYYYYKGWYLYWNNSWIKSIVPSDDVKMNPDNYYDYSSSSYDTYNFKDSSYYKDSYSKDRSSNDSSWSSSSNDNWDSGSYWDSNDSWDSGSTDWGSDW